MALTRPRYSQIYDTDYKQSVRLATTADVGNLLASSSITNSVDGRTVSANDRILVKDQNDLKQNGIYRVVTAGTGSNGTWVRSLDADASDKVTSGMTTTVSEGTTNAYKTFRLATSDPIVLGTTELTYVDPFQAGAAAGSTGDVQFNDSGVAGGSSGFTFNKLSNLVAISGNVTAANIIVSNGSGQFSGYFNESTTTSGVFIGNAGSGTPSPRIGFFNGNSSQNWQIDNYGGSFRWYLPGSTKLTIAATGNVITYGSILPSANVTYDLGSPTQRWRTGYFSAGTIDLGGSTISVDPVNGFTFSIAGAATPTTFSPSGALVGNSLTLTNTTTATSTTTGALIVNGGVGVAGNVYAQTFVGDGSLLTGLYSNVQLTAYLATGTVTVGTINSPSIGNASARLTGTLQTASQTNITSVGTLTGLTSSGIVSITNTTAATTYNNGALVVSGGVGIAKDLWVQGNIYTANLTSTSYFAANITSPLLYLETTSDYPYNYDIGFYSHYTGGPANVYAHTGIIRNDSDGAWYLFSNVAEPVTAQINFTNAIYDALILGNITIKNGSVALINGQSSGTGDIGASGARFGTVYASNENITGTATIGAINSPSIGNASAQLTGTLQTASQTNITAVGTLGSLAVSGTATIGAINSPSIGNASARLTGTIQTAAQTNITSVGTLTGLTVSGTATIGTINSPSIGNASAQLTGTLQTAAQTNITSVGTLTGLNVSGTFNAAYNAVGQVQMGGDSNGSIEIGQAGRASSGVPFIDFHSSVNSPDFDVRIQASGGSSAASGTGQLQLTASGGVVPGSDNSTNLGASGTRWATVYGVTFSGISTQAKYADLAEKYTSDKKYVPGTVVIFGGTAEVTISTQSHDPSVAGVVSTDPGFLMNSELEEGVSIALQGRVPCRVLGPVAKGDRVVSSDVRGVAERLDMSKYQPGCIIGKSLESVPDGEIATIEVVVGRN